jgi:cytochrome P450
VVSVLRDQATWQVGPTDQQIASGLTEEPGMLQANPPRHTRLRSLVAQAFTPRMVEQLEPRVRTVANELLDAVAGLEQIDAVEALTYPLPVIMIAEILGVPAEDRADFKRWSDAVVSTLGINVAMSDEVQRSVEELREYFGRLIEERRKAPRADLISALIAAEEVARLRAQPELMPTAIEEVLRFSSPVQATVRRAMRDVELRGHIIPEGQEVIVWLASANRDADQFPDPDRFDIGRTPNRHLGFGLGIHFCLGAPLARLEAKVAMEVFLQRYRHFERASEGMLPRVPTFIMHGVRELPLSVR